jgi:hypothetical protein
MRGRRGTLRASLATPGTRHARAAPWSADRRINAVIALGIRGHTRGVGSERRCMRKRCVARKTCAVPRRQPRVLSVGRTVCRLARAVHSSVGMHPGVNQALSNANDDLSQQDTEAFRFLRSRGDSMQVHAGTVLGDRYLIERRLGGGGMGSVWLARDLALQCRCAVKLLDPEVAELEQARERFMREARVSARIRGSAVVNVFDCGECGGVPFMVMEHLEGEDLRSRIDRDGALGPFRRRSISGGRKRRRGIRMIDFSRPRSLRTPSVMRSSCRARACPRSALQLGRSLRTGRGAGSPRQARSAGPSSPLASS